jgi:hypothetical protein
MGSDFPEVWRNIVGSENTGSKNNITTTVNMINSNE